MVSIVQPGIPVIFWADDATSVDSPATMPSEEKRGNYSLPLPRTYLTVRSYLQGWISPLKTLLCLTDACAYDIQCLALGARNRLSAHV